MFWKSKRELKNRIILLQEQVEEQCDYIKELEEFIRKYKCFEYEIEIKKLKAELEEKTKLLEEQKIHNDELHRRIDKIEGQVLSVLKSTKLDK